MRTTFKSPYSTLIDRLYGKLVSDVIKDLPEALKPFKESNLNALFVSTLGMPLLQACGGKHLRCLAYLLDLGLDPFILSRSKVGWSAVHEAITHLSPIRHRLMGFAFIDTRFHGFTTGDGTTVENLLAELPEEEQAAFRETQTIFCTYRSYHDSAERAANLAPPDHLLAALHYFLAANQMKTQVADAEDDDYLKRFHLKKVVGDLRKAIEHYYQAILVRREIPAVLEELDQCLALSAEIIDSVEPDHPERDWEIKLGDETFFEDWRVQLGDLQKWREERRISFSSTSSDTSTSGVEVDVKPSGETEDEAVSLLGKEGLRCRK